MGNTAPFNQDQQSRERVQRLFLEHVDRIRGYVRVILPDADLARDVIQDSLLAVCFPSMSVPMMPTGEES